jgi:hypothetical protein
MPISFSLTNQLALDFCMPIMEKLLFTYYIPWQQIKVFYPWSMIEEAAKDIAATVHVFENFSKFVGHMVSELYGASTSLLQEGANGQHSRLGRHYSYCGV